MYASRSFLSSPVSSSSIEARRAPTEAGEARSARLRPEPFSPLKAAPRPAAKLFTSEIPSAVLPRSPNSPATSFSSISARKLSEGVLVSRARSDSGCDATAATSEASPGFSGTVPRLILRPILTPARRRASARRPAAARSGAR